MAADQVGQLVGDLIHICGARLFGRQHSAQEAAARLLLTLGNHGVDEFVKLLTVIVLDPFNGKEQTAKAV